MPKKRKQLPQPKPIRRPSFQMIPQGWAECFGVSMGESIQNHHWHSSHEIEPIGDIYQLVVDFAGCDPNRTIMETNRIRIMCRRNTVAILDQSDGTETDQIVFVVRPFAGGGHGHRSFRTLYDELDAHLQVGHLIAGTLIKKME